MKKIRKICVVGSPGSGKTTLCTGLFYFLKLLGEHVELVPELIKYKVYKNISFGNDGFDIQNTLEQKEFEEVFETPKALKQIDYVICEAPLCNGYFYSSFYNKELEYPILKKIAQNKINTYDLILFVERIENQYVSFGRKETLAEAKKLEEHIKNQIIELDYQNPIMYVNQKTNLKEILKVLGIEESKLSEILK